MGRRTNYESLQRYLDAYNSNLSIEDKISMAGFYFELSERNFRDIIEGFQFVSEFEVDNSNKEALRYAKFAFFHALPDVSKCYKYSGIYPVQEILDHWDANKNSIERGCILKRENDLIREKLCIDDRDNISLQDIRDLTVLYIGHDDDDPYSDKAMWYWDCMSAITAVIDNEKYKRGMDI